MTDRNPEPALPDLARECEPCGGHGVVTNPGWLEHDTRAQAARKRWQEDHPGEDWYSSVEGRRMEDAYPDDPEWMCAECDGSGSQPTEAGRALLRFLRVHGKGGQR